MARHCYVLRVFTTDDAGGNHLGVVTDVTGLSEQTMQEIAADLGYSKTIFIDWRQGGTPRVRIFTPAVELPFAGHPLVGAAWLLTSLGPGDVDRIACAAFEAGIRNDGERAWVDLPLSDDVRPVTEPAQLMEPLGVGDPLDGAWVHQPFPYLLVEVADPAELARAAPSPAGPSLCYLYCWTAGDRLRARFFAAGHGVVEDPATGSAAVALAARLRAQGREDGDLVIEQGIEMGHPSQIRISWSGARGALGGTVRQAELVELDV